MQKRLVIIVVALNCYALFSCNTDKSEKTSNPNVENSSFDKKWATLFLDSMNAKFSEQIAAGDSLTLASHYWPDAELLLDNSEPVKGNNIASAWGAAMRMGLKEMTFSTTDITGSATFLIETGAYEMKDEKKGVLDKGKYVVVWEKRNEQWKLYRDIGCTSLKAAK